MSLTEARVRTVVLERRPSRPAAPELALDDFAFETPAPRRSLRQPTKVAEQPEPATHAPIIPPQSVAGRALLGVIAIMSFLAALTLGAVVLVRTATTDWQSQVTREVTIQVRPVDGRNIEADVTRAAELARATRGIAQARPYTKAESAKLLEPWLGHGATVDQLPIPRLIVLTLATGAAADLEGLRARLAAEVPAASLDDHRAFMDRMRSITRTTLTGGLALLGLVLAATILLVAFATKGAMAANRMIVEVLHFVGAKNRYIAGQFQRHFLMIGLKGAAIGGGMAAAIFLLPRALGLFEGRAPAFDFAWPGMTLGADGYAGILGLVILVAAVTAITSRWTVHRALADLD